MAGNQRYDIGEGMTSVDEDLGPLLTGLPTTPVEVCAVAQAGRPTCASDDEAAVGDLYAAEDLTAPAALLV